MAITVHCPGCDAVIGVADSAAGKRVKCKECGTAVRVEANDEPHAGAPPPVPGRRKKAAAPARAGNSLRSLVVPAIALVGLAVFAVAAKFGYDAIREAVAKGPGGPEAPGGPAAANAPAGSAAPVKKTPEQEDILPVSLFPPVNVGDPDPPLPYGWATVSDEAAGFRISLPTEPVRKTAASGPTYDFTGETLTVGIQSLRSIGGESALDGHYQDTAQHAAPATQERFVWQDRPARQIRMRNLAKYPQSVMWVVATGKHVIMVVIHFQTKEGDFATANRILHSLRLE